MAINPKKSRASNSNFITLETTKGNIIIKTLPKLAPMHVKRIKQLVKSGFYDGILFHRVIPGFMAQTGDPLGNGTGGSGKNLKAEFTDHEYKYGTVGMARSMNQFYRIVRYGVVQIPAGWVPRIFKMELIISCCSNPVPFR